MEQNSGEGQPQVGLELPPSKESGQSAEIQHDQALEKGAPDENKVGKQQPPPFAPIDPAAIALPAAPIDDQTQTATTVSTGGPAAKDNHIIEKVWVDKAKAVIAQTRDDPFIQKKEMSKVKADYIKQRFNKTIPATDDTAAA